MLLLLKSLPMGCYFNIYGFGSNFESFFPLVTRSSSFIDIQVCNVSVEIGCFSVFAVKVSCTIRKQWIRL